MATRIKYSKDGSVGYAYNVDTNTMGKTLSAAEMTVIDGDNLVATEVVINNNDLLSINFPSAFTLSKIIAKIDRNVGTFDVYSSTDSVTGLDGDGTFNSMLTTTSYTTPNYTTYTPTSNNAGITWLRVGPFEDPLCLHIFGDYDSPRMEFWDSGEVAVLTGDYPLDFGNILSSADFDSYLAFKIKNLSGGARTYTVTVGANKYGGDTTVTDNITVQEGAGGTPAYPSITTASVANGAFSAEIRINYSLLGASNPRDALHQFWWSASEAS